MNESTVAKRYAQALGDLAFEQDLLQDVGTELNQFVEVVVATPEIKGLFASPTVSEENQAATLQVYLEKAAPSTLTSNFLQLLIQKRRMMLIEEIVAAYNLDVDARSGRITVEVRVPKEMTLTHTKQLTEVLAEKTGKEVELDVQLDPSLLGGMVVRMGSVMLDYSVRNQLNQLKAQIRG